MPILTVFTPTFNRGYILHQCYESLKRQTNKEFIWLIIDDGSSDNTEELVNSWIKDNDISISYFKQENQGMHGAHNTAYSLIDTELNVCIDSDDYMPDDAIEKIISFWRKHGSNEVGGMIGLDCKSNGDIIGTKLPAELKKSTLFNLYQKKGVKGDKKIVYRTELSKKFPYPVFPNEKLVPLSYKYFMLDLECELLLLNEPLCVVEYLPDGSSMNIFRQYRNSANGFRFYRMEMMKLPNTSLTFKFKQAVHYVSCSLFTESRSLTMQSPQKLLTIFALPLGVILNKYINFKIQRSD
ncbi:glycosyltransferase family 2 protein [Metabacillus litoralis]|uniref:glycosyltransferase family 2 protein n=1 Tax=Metabacillus TaxID=2675233 RepID=UPI000EF61E84|nr:glycosyltransferase family A protein [Metabacillus litoralis]MCM3412443.1 glycosyltransferase family 2 protein [Metabacillus litoralis]UHA57905.1 glycosyltransferase family 2 protein [Metabacillus litoralis]